MSFNFEITVSDKKPENILAGAIEIAIRDAEIHGTDLVIEEGGEIKRLSPAEMRARLKHA